MYFNRPVFMKALFIKRLLPRKSDTNLHEEAYHQLIFLKEYII